MMDPNCHVRVLVDGSRPGEGVYISMKFEYKFEISEVNCTNWKIQGTQTISKIQPNKTILVGQISCEDKAKRLCFANATFDTDRCSLINIRRFPFIGDESGAHQDNEQFLCIPPEVEGIPYWTIILAAGSLLLLLVTIWYLNRRKAQQYRGPRTEESRTEDTYFTANDAEQIQDMNGQETTVNPLYGTRNAAYEVISDTTSQGPPSHETELTSLETITIAPVVTPRPDSPSACAEPYHMTTEEPSQPLKLTSQETHNYEVIQDSSLPAGTSSQIGNCVVPGNIYHEITEVRSSRND